MSNADHVIGLDVGSRSIKMVRWDGNQIADWAKTPTTFDPLAGIRHLLPQADQERVMVTGTGRDVFQERLGHEGTKVVGTIQSLAKGARHLYPETRTVLDIGGLNTMVILLTPEGEIKNYEAGSRCAAGTGKYLEFMATSMQVPLEDFGAYAMQTDRRVSIDAHCTIFAESEAMFKVAGGEEPAAIARGLHYAHVQMSLEALQRIGGRPPVFFCGGVAHNPCIKQLLQAEWKDGLVIPENPDLVTALGAALHAA